MANEFPKSYKDPLYASLDAAHARQFGIPDNLLNAIRTAGEKTDAGRKSPVGANTPYQIMPSIRETMLKRTGIDAYLSPENASKISTMLLKESLDRNKGSVEAAIGEYHGGTSRKSWGPINQAYRKRVMSAIGEEPAAASQAENAQSSSKKVYSVDNQTTFDRVFSSMQPKKQDEQSIDNIYSAYKSGKMDSAARTHFEEDVKSGKIMLPRGASMPGQEGEGNARELSKNIWDAYVSNKMDANAQQQLEEDVQNGRVKPPAQDALTKGVTDPALFTIGDKVASKMSLSARQKPEPGFVDQAIGAADAAGTLITAGTTGVIGGIAGAAKGAYDSVSGNQFGTQQGVRTIEQGMQTGMQAGTRSPSTQSGQDQVAAVGDALQYLPPVIGAANPGVLAKSMQPAGQIAQTGAARVLQAAETGLPAAAQKAAAIPKAMAAAPKAAYNKVKDFVVRNDAIPPEPDVIPGAGGVGQSVGAAATDLITQRRMLGESTGIKLSRGDVERTPETQGFENMQAGQESGKAIAEFRAQQRASIDQKLDSMFEETGAQKREPAAVGRSIVDETLAPLKAKLKAETGSKYNKAAAAGEMKQKIGINPIVDYLNSSAGELSSPSVSEFVNRLKSIGAIKNMPDGSFAQKSVKQKIGEGAKSEISPISINDLEGLRQGIRASQKSDVLNASNMAAGQKAIQAIDSILDSGVGGPLYRDARLSYRRGKQLFDNRSVVADLLGKKKAGSDDRKVALEDVFSRVVLKGSKEDFSHLSHTLRQAGDAGEQALKDLRGATIEHIKSQTFKSPGPDQRVSAFGLKKAVESLDEDGKLTVIFGKKGAEQLRDFKDVVGLVSTSAPELANPSGTAGAVARALGLFADMGAGQMVTGLPIPALAMLKKATQHLKEKQIQKKIEDALKQPTDLKQKTGTKF